MFVFFLTVAATIIFSLINLASNPGKLKKALIFMGFLIIVVGIAYLASAIMTILPARSASKVPVAEALRYE